MTKDDLRNKYPWVHYWSDKSIVNWMAESAETIFNNSDKIYGTALFQMYKTLFEHFKIKTVFDMGCGPGQSLRLLKKIYPHITCIGGDISHELLKVAEQILPDDYFCQCDALNIGFKDRAFDMVISEDLQCIVADNRTLLQELCRVTDHILCLTLRLRGRGRTLTDLNDSYQLVESVGIKVPFVSLNFREFSEIISEAAPNASFVFCTGYRLPLSQTIHIKDIKDYLTVGIVAIDMRGEFQALPGKKMNFREQCHVLNKAWEENNIW